MTSPPATSRPPSDAPQGAPNRDSAPPAQSASAAALTSRFARLRVAVRQSIAAEGIAWALVAVAGFVFVSYLADRGLRLSTPMRATLLVASLAGFAWLMWRRLIAPLRVRLHPLDLAAMLDRVAARDVKRERDAKAANESTAAEVAQPQFEPVTRTNPAASTEPPLAPRVATVLQLEHAGGSVELIGEAVRRASASLESAAIESRWDPQRRRKGVAIAAAALAIVVVWCVVDVTSASLWARRWLLLQHTPWPQDTYLVIDGADDGVIMAPRGEPYTLRVGVRDGSVEPEAVSLQYRDPAGQRVTAAMTRFAAGDFRYEFAPIRDDVRITLEGGDDQPAPVTIQPIDRPTLAAAELTTHHPSQAQPARQSLDAQGALAFLTDTDIRLRFTSDVDLATASLESADDTSAPALTRIDRRTFEATWTHRKPLRLRYAMMGSVGAMTSRPIPLAIGLRRDATPAVSLQMFRVHGRVTARARIPVKATARDDAGLRSLGLNLTWLQRDDDAPASAGASASDVEADATTESDDASASLVAAEPTPAQTKRFNLAGPFDPADARQLERDAVVRLTDLDIKPGARVTLVASADDDAWAGAQTGLSRELQLQVVSDDEMLRDFLRQMQSLRSELRAVRDDAGKLHAAMARAIDLNDVIDWSRRHQAGRQQVWQITGRLESLVEEMALNGLTSPQAGELLQKQVLAPLHALYEGRMNQQREALADVDRAGTREAVIPLERAELLIVHDLDEVLRQMQQWDSFMDVLVQLNQVMTIWTGVIERTESARDGRVLELFDD